MSIFVNRKLYRIVALLAVCIYSGTALAECKLSLTYKEVGKHGYMAPAPSNQGLYQALYTEVADIMGCELVIHRYPKKRTHLLLKNGQIDLYPSTGFDLKRSEYLFYVPNGLFRFEPYYGLTPATVPDLNSIEAIGQHQLTWIFEAGRTSLNQAKRWGLSYREIPALSDTQAIEMLRRGRDVFYRIIRSDYDRYLSQHNFPDLDRFGIKMHPACCQAKSQMLYTGISRFSSIIQEEPNPDYQPMHPRSPENFPTRLVAGSMAQRLSQVLTQLQRSGWVDALLAQYIGDK